MITKHLTDAQRDQFNACGMFAIDGEPSPESAPTNAAASVGADSVLAEGWRILTEPCDTCDGWNLGKTVKPGPGGTIVFTPCPNPDCVGGRRVVTLTATCPKCEGEGILGINLEPPDQGIHWCDCNEGEVTLGRFTIPALLPVQGGGIIEQDVGVERVVLIVTLDFEPTEVVHYTPTGPGESTFEVLDLDPRLVRPGQFIVRPERVPESQVQERNQP